MKQTTTNAPRRGRRLACAIAAAAVLCTGPAAAAEELRIGGTGNALGAMQLLATAYALRNPGTRVVVLPSIGTSGAIKAVAKDALAIGLSSRALTDEESALGAIAVEYARTPLVFAVASTSSAMALTLGQIADIYNGKLANWPDGTQIRPVLRQAGDDNTRQIRQISAAMDLALTAAEQRPGMPFATNDQETADKLQSIPGAFGATALGLILSEGRPLRALKLDGVEPTASNGASGKYPYAKRFFYITRPDPSATAKAFIAFIESPAGRDILVHAGHWIP
jgi:phosphate transport system substrate-binding protein